jgi:hypothetical protein
VNSVPCCGLLDMLARPVAEGAVPGWPGRRAGRRPVRLRRHARSPGSQDAESARRPAWWLLPASAPPLISLNWTPPRRRWG